MASTSDRRGFSEYRAVGQCISVSRPTSRFVLRSSRTLYATVHQFSSATRLCTKCQSRDENACNRYGRDDLQVGKAKECKKCKLDNVPEVEDTPKAPKRLVKRNHIQHQLCSERPPLRSSFDSHASHQMQQQNNRFPLSKRTVELVRDLMAEDFWPEVNVKLTFFERNLAMNEPTDAHASTFVPALEVLRAILQNQKRERIVQSANQLGHLLAKSLRSESTAIQEALQPLLRVILAAVAEEPIEEESDTTQFINHLVQVAQDNFAAFTNLNTAHHSRRTFPESSGYSRHRFNEPRQSVSKTCKRSHHPSSNRASSSAAATVAVALSAALPRHRPIMLPLFLQLYLQRPSYH